MIWRAQLVLLAALAIAGCGTARNVAVSSFRVVDAPAQFIRNRIDPPQTTTTTTTTDQYANSDVRNPGAPVNPPPPTPTPARHIASQKRETQKKSTPVPSTATTSHRKPTPSATPRPVATQAVQFPTARPVPGKPGYVYSIDPKGGIVDVTGYKTGDRAKDPYTQQVFIVP